MQNLSMLLTPLSLKKARINIWSRLLKPLRPRPPKPPRPKKVKAKRKARRKAFLPSKKKPSKPTSRKDSVDLPQAWD